MAGFAKNRVKFFPYKIKENRESFSSIRILLLMTGVLASNRSKIVQTVKGLILVSQNMQIIMEI